MPDAFGAISFPVDTPNDDESAGDPGLSYIGSFLKAAINAACTDEWDTVCKGRNAVDFVVLNDPASTFDESRLPALYLFRSSFAPKIIADDYLEDAGQITCYWVMEPAQEEHIKARSNMVNAIMKSAFRALVKGRDPAWIVDGDTDTAAAVRGSFLWRYAGIDRATVVTPKPLTLQLNKLDANERQMTYSGLAMMVQIREVSSTDASIGRQPNASDGTITTNDDLSQETIYGTPAAG